MQPVTKSQQEEARYERWKRETALSMAAQSSKKDTLQTRPIEKRNENNLIGQAWSDVTK
jgi:hypothetical protein